MPEWPFILNSSESIIEETDINTDYDGTYFIQAVSHIIRKIKAHYYNLPQRAGVTPPINMDGDISAIDNLTKPYIVVCTSLPQKKR